MNFRNYADNHIGEASGGKPSPANVTLVRQPSIYSLTFDEFQNTMSGIGKDFGSMNMDELLKNIWSAEEIQALASSAGVEGNNLGGNLQRQGSFTLPRTLSQKTVDEVWRDLIKDTGGAKDGSGIGGSAIPQRQQTLGEMTLEEFLVRAGVVREDVPQQIGRPNVNGWFGELSRANNNAGLVLGFQQPNINNGNLGNRIVESKSPVSKQPTSLTLNGIPSQQQTQQHHQPPLFPKPANVTFAPTMQLLNNAQLASPGTRGRMIGVQEHPINGGLVQSSALPGVGMVGLSSANVGGAGSPVSQISPDVITKGSGDTSSLSPIPYVINRGRKCSAIEKVVERRHRRMIKNRESAARSRARKQAYTLELEAEVAKLKEMNQELQRKQAEIMEMQKKQDLESRSWSCKRQCLRRTLTGPW
ncbi:hypothetical protein L6164_035678 [Bauhinia variegata]|uniref:Uncharacterized protein n=1 Tax=Bauhinia variegata TaxID=167791 RepID=A0ACB9KEP4_BAUVA|nr:hypothetical protein L6164_035678 [Bauhinia variegata]